MHEPSSSVVKSTARAIDVLELLACAPEGLSLREISEQLRLAKSSAFGLMSTLVQRGAVRTEPRGRHSVFLVGRKMFEIGQSYALSSDLVRDGQQAVQDLTLATDETSHLAVLEGREVIYLAKCDSPKPVRMVSAIGKRLPAHSTGVGKVLLAALADAEVTSLLDAPGSMQPITTHTITAIDQLITELGAIRRAGVATEREESTEGVGCVAAPVYDISGVVAALSVSVPVSRFSAERVDPLTTEVLRCASALSSRLGARRYPDAIACGI